MTAVPINIAEGMIKGFVRHPRTHNLFKYFSLISKNRSPDGSRLRQRFSGEKLRFWRLSRKWILWLSFFNNYNFRDRRFRSTFLTFGWFQPCTTQKIIDGRLQNVHTQKSHLTTEVNRKIFPTSEERIYFSLYLKMKSLFRVQF